MFMPFAPLPTNFLNIFDNLSDSGFTILELGCGEGNFSQLIKRSGISLFGMDYSVLSGNNDLHLVGNALCPPILPGSVDLILAANLVRHLLPMKKFQKMISDKADQRSWKVELENNRLVADDKAVLSFLGGSGGEVSPEVSRLMVSIGFNGLAYGQYWWAQWERVV